LFKNPEHGLLRIECKLHRNGIGIIRLATPSGIAFIEKADLIEQG